MALEIKQKYKDKHIKFLKEKKLIIKESDIKKIESYIINYGADTIINDFKFPFLYDYKQDLFLKDVDCI